MTIEKYCIRKELIVDKESTFKQDIMSDMEQQDSTAKVVLVAKDIRDMTVKSLEVHFSLSVLKELEEKKYSKDILFKLVEINFFEYIKDMRKGYLERILIKSKSQREDFVNGESIKFGSFTESSLTVSQSQIYDY